MADLRAAAQQALKYLEAQPEKLWPAGTQHLVINDLRVALDQHDKDRAWINSRKPDWKEQVKLAREAQEREHADELTVAYMLGYQNGRDHAKAK